MNSVVIIGPTAAGKSSLGMRLAEKIGGEIISIDSRQIYRGLDIGTAKPSEDEQTRIRHHCIDILDITEKSNARWFADLARQSMEKIRSDGKIPVLVGGSGLYLRSITQGLFEIDLDPSDRLEFEKGIEDVANVVLYSRLRSSDPESAERIHENDMYRIVRALEVQRLTGMSLSDHFRRQKEECPDGIRGLIRIGLDVDRELLRARIALRTGEMYDAGWPDEVSGLLEGGADPACPGLQTLGYPETIRFVRGDLSLRAVKEKISMLTGQYAKRQMTWFRKEPEVTWFDAEDIYLLDSVLNILDSAGAS
jgi:tRNA dimethylallyltransferase